MCIRDRFIDREDKWILNDISPADEELKILHKTIKKVTEDIGNLSFNTAISAMMIFVNEMKRLECNKKEIMMPVLKVIAPFAPFIAEELWSQLGNTRSVSMETFPEFNPAHLVENTFEYPVSFNGKTRFKLVLPAPLTVPEIEKTALEAKESEKWLEGKSPRKVIIVPKKIINTVI